MTALLPDHRDRQDTAALSGLLCAIVFVGGLLVTGLLVGESAPPNMPGSAPADIQRYFLDNAEIARVQALTQTAAAILLVVFTGVVAARIRALDGPTARLAPIAHPVASSPRRSWRSRPCWPARSAPSGSPPAKRPSARCAS